MKLLTKEEFKPYLYDNMYANGCEGLALRDPDFPNPYDCCYVFQDYVNDVEIDGKTYELRACHTNYMYMLGYEGDTLRFYMYIETPEDFCNTVGEYIEANKLYQIEDLDPKDFGDYGDKDE